MAPNQMAVNPTTITSGLSRRAQRIVETSKEARISSPPMVGVPALWLCVSIISLRMLSPTFSFRNFLITKGPRTRQIKSAVMAA